MQSTAQVGSTFLAYCVVLDADGEQSASDDIALDVEYPDRTTDSVTPMEATTDELDKINAEHALDPDWTTLTDPTGVYVATLDVTQEGNHWGRFSYTDPVDEARQFAWFAYPQRVVIEVA